jgi:hypothetical protein
MKKLPGCNEEYTMINESELIKKTSMKASFLKMELLLSWYLLGSISCMFKINAKTKKPTAPRIIGAK